jgi:hypothetical protein
MDPSIYSRYYGLATIEVDGVVSLVERPPAPDTEPGSLIHMCVGDETLDQLAKAYYGREDLWWRIADANAARFPFEWSAGDSIVVPPLPHATRTPRR